MKLIFVDVRSRVIPLLDFYIIICIVWETDRNMLVRVFYLMNPDILGNRLYLVLS